MGNAPSGLDQQGPFGLGCCQQVRMPNIQTIGEDCQQMKLPTIQSLRDDCGQIQFPIVNVIGVSSLHEDHVAEAAAADGLEGPMFGGVVMEPRTLEAARDDASLKNGKAEDQASNDSTEASLTGAPEEDNSQAQHIVQDFVRMFVKGCVLSVLTTNGGEADCIVSLDRKLTTLSVQRSNKKGATKHGIPLEQVRKIYVGEEADQEDRVPKVDGMCVTVRCLPGQALAFRFADFEERDTFVLCLSMFADRVKEDIQRKQQGSGSPRSSASSAADEDEASSFLGVDFGNEEERPMAVHVTPSAPVARVNW